MLRAPIPDQVTIAGHDYEVLPLPHVRRHGEELDALACHDTRRVWVSLAAPLAVRLAAIEQVCREGELLALTAGPMERVA